MEIGGVIYMISFNIGDIVFISKEEAEKHIT